MRLQELSSARLAVLWSDLLGRGLSWRTVAYSATVLRMALRDAVEAQPPLLAKNPTDVRAGLPRFAARVAKPPKPVVWDADQLHRYLAHAGDERLRAALRLAVTTGLRRGEVLGLRWRDVDLDRARVQVSQTLILVDGKLAWSTPKS